jgi:hypothetical protein
MCTSFDIIVMEIAKLSHRFLPRGSILAIVDDIIIFIFFQKIKSKINMDFHVYII